MIYAKAPLRISLFGGGSDYQTYFDQYKGHVLGGTIDLSVHVMLLPLANEALENIKFTYRMTESVKSIDELTHPAVKAILQRLNWTEKINLATMADVPGQTGLGSSSAFTVATTQALLAFRGSGVKPTELANFAVQIERNDLKEAGGVQDQYHTAIGGFRHYQFNRSEVSFSEPLMDVQDLQFLSGHSFIVNSGLTRGEDNGATVTANAAKSNKVVLINELARQAESVAVQIPKISGSSEKLRFLGHELGVAWSRKLAILGGNVPVRATSIIEVAQKYGVLGAKLLGSGGGGFIFMLVDPSKREEFLHEMRDFKPREISFTSQGSTVSIV